MFISKTSPQTREFIRSKKRNDTLSVLHAPLNDIHDGRRATHRHPQILEREWDESE